MSDESIATALGGELIADGLIRVITSWPSNHVHGKVPISSLHDMNISSLLGYEEPLQRLIAIDTETTGLSGGSGTVAFNIGCATIQPAGLEVTQFLLTKYGGESRMLVELSEILAGAQALITYNGKTFDLPLLATRFRMQRRRAPFQHTPHLDLLHPVRSLFGRTWPDCRLTTAENFALGFTRTDDLPGFLVPATWVEFLKNREASGLGRVLEHNRLDVVSLLALAAKLTQVMETSPDSTSNEHVMDVDPLALARMLRKRGHRERGLALLESAQHRLAPAGQLELAREWRRLGRESEAIAIWERLAAHGLPEAIESCAKFHEHSSKDIPTAMRYTKELISLSGRRPPHLHRLARLSRKLTS